MCTRLIALLIALALGIQARPLDAQGRIEFSSKRSSKPSRTSKFRKFSYSKTSFLRLQKKRLANPIISSGAADGNAGDTLSNQRPSRSYQTNGAVDAQVCQGDGIFNSYDAYLDCSDLAISECTNSDPSEKAFCIYQRCGNTPDNFEGLWRDLPTQDLTSSSQQFYKSNFGSSTFGSDSFAVSLHPCLNDGAGRFYTSSNTAALIMGHSFSLGSTDLQLFHPGKTENMNLSTGRARLGFNGSYLLTIRRDDFGGTTVPFTYKQEVFKSFPRTVEGADYVYWVDKVIPVTMVFRPQGVIGIEIDARVSPEARVLEVNFSGYNDFGTSSDAGPTRDGVIRNSSTGVLSLVQSEYRTNKFISMNADDSSMLPSISELSQLEFWPAKGGFGPVCAQWFKSVTTHPEFSYRCSTLVDFGPLSQRKGLVLTPNDGSSRLFYYRDYSEGGDDGVLKPYPYRTPILDGF